MTNFRAKFSALSLTEKGIIIGSAILTFSTLMPWYADLSAYGAGDVFHGVTGPLFAIGLLVAAFGAITFAYHFFPLINRRLPKLPIKKSNLGVFLGIQSLMFLLIANSIFFHPKFGVNITMKETRFGMMVALVGMVVMVVSSVIQARHIKRNEPVPDVFGEQAPLIDVTEQEKAPHPTYAGETVATDRQFSINHSGQNIVDKATERVAAERREQRDLEGSSSVVEPVTRTENKEPANIENMRIRMDL